ncbi:MAG: hypothetical protein COC01_01560 [Bacteroidetes bacterium]|nr:MAG: hypothetical protein COC01_01560 [Bacteroidota bacterium]
MKNEELKRGLLPACYLPPIEYFAYLLKFDKVFFEYHEHFVKQTCRNRCSIYGANGKLNLVVPIQHTGERMKMKDVKISHTENWKKLHWKSLKAAYRSSPFFEFYEDNFQALYEQKFEFLVDLNEAVQNTVLKILGLEINTEKTTSYQKEHPETLDLRNCFSKNMPPYTNHFPSYTQVFTDKYDFLPNLCIVDLLFNKGPQTIEYLRVTSKII